MNNPIPLIKALAKPYQAMVTEAVNDWLDDHPEATTTVEDESITAAKLVPALSAKIQRITSFAEFAAAIGSGDNTDSYSGGEITVTSSIQLSSSDQCVYKSFEGMIFNLQSDLFTWATPTDAFTIPNFVNCTFIGNGNSICADGTYICRGKFVNCNFIDCALIHEGYLVQSTRFVNCTIENPSTTPFIHALRVYDTKFIGCQCEGENDATLVYAYTTTANQLSISKLSFVSCIFEGQSAEIVIMHDGDVFIQDCYTEANAKPFVKTLASNFAQNAILRLNIIGTLIGHSSGVYFAEIDDSFASSSRTKFSCLDSHMSVCKLINRSDFQYFTISNTSIESSATRPASIELSKIDPIKNSVADFTTNGHVIVKKFPALISFDSSDGGWHTNLYMVSLSYGNRPCVVCLSDPTKTPSAAYDSETGNVDVTLHNSSSSYNNRSAVLLNGLTNDLIRKDAYSPITHGY